MLLTVFVFCNILCFARASNSNITCIFNDDCSRSGQYDTCCTGGGFTRYCSTWMYCDGYCQFPKDCGIGEFCVDRYCRRVPGTGTLYCFTDQDCFNANTLHYLKYVECFNKQCLPFQCKSCPTSCENGQCKRAKSHEDSHSFSPASIIGFTAVVLIGSCIACTLYCGCARRRQQPSMSMPAARHEVESEQQQQQQQHGSPLPSPSLHPDAPPPYHSLEMIDRIQVEPPPPSYAEAVRNSQNNLGSV